MGNEWLQMAQDRSKWRNLKTRGRPTRAEEEDTYFSFKHYFVCSILNYCFIIQKSNYLAAMKGFIQTWLTCDLLYTFSNHTFL